MNPALGVLVGLVVFGLVVLSYREVGLYLQRFVRVSGRRRWWLYGLVALPIALALVRGWGPLDPTGVLRVVGRMAIVVHLAVVTAAIPLVLIRKLGARLAKAPVPPTIEPPAPAPITRREVIERALGGAAIVASGSVYARGVARRLEIETRTVEVKLAKLPRALDGFTLVQLSDIHVGPFIGEAALAMGIELVRAQRPDAIVLTGDIVDHDPSYIPLAARMLGRLTARAGTFCVSGNHDYYTGVDEVLAALARAGVRPLRNAGTVLEGGIGLLGVEDLWASRGRGGSPPNVLQAIADVPRDLPRVLLAHQPPFFDEPDVDVDLQLSGHTHGGQINPGFTPSKLLFPYVAGRYDGARGRTLYVNRGFGTAGPPCRILAPSEITKIVLVRG